MLALRLGLIGLVWAVCLAIWIRARSSGGYVPIAWILGLWAAVAVALTVFWLMIT